MQFESHERARLLLDQAMVEGISQDDRRWLSSHTAACAECGQYAELSRRAIAALDAFAFDVDREAVLRVQEAVQRHAAGRRFSVGIPAAIALTIGGSLVVWESAAWLAGRWHLPAPAWQIAFAVFWLLPSVLVDILLFYPKHLIGGERERL